DMPVGRPAAEQAPAPMPTPVARPAPPRLELADEPYLELVDEVPIELPPELAPNDAPPAELPAEPLGATLPLQPRVVVTPPTSVERTVPLVSPLAPQSPKAPPAGQRAERYKDGASRTRPAWPFVAAFTALGLSIGAMLHLTRSHTANVVAATS